MERTYWHRQTGGRPLFPDFLWSRPENRAHAGKLAIVGGNLHSFAAPAEAYSEAVKAGIGTARVVLPDSLKSTVGKVFEAGEYAPSTPSGSFAGTALGELLSAAEWADGVLLAGDFGRNSETAILLEKFLEKYTGQLTMNGDAIDYLLTNPNAVLNRGDVTVVVDFAQLQKMATAAKFPTPFASAMDFLHRIDALHELSASYKANVILPNENSVFVAVQGEISTTQFETLPSQTAIAAHASVWWLQNPAKSFEALTSSLLTAL